MIQKFSRLIRAHATYRDPYCSNKGTAKSPQCSMTPPHVLLLLTLTQALNYQTTIARHTTRLLRPTAAPTSNGRAAAKGGASLVQLRDADASRDELETAAAAVRDALQGTDCSVVINGVEHLPERKWRAATERPNGPLGCSAHSVEAVLAAAALGADYVQLGTMFATQTHPGKIPEGPGLATECRRALDELEATPLLGVALDELEAPPLLIGVGGVDATNAAKLIEAGCDGVAVIRGISDARDPEAAARAICRALAGAGTRISKAAQNTRAETTAQNAADVRELMRTRLSMTEAELDRMVRRRPLGARATVEPKLDWLQTHFDLDAAQVKKMVLALPALLTQSVEKMESNCDWLQRRLGLDDSGLKKVVLENPSLLAFSVEDNMEPKLDWLQDRLNLDAAQLKKVVLGRPSLLGYSVEDNMAPKLDWLQTRLELDAAQLKKLVVAQPTLLGYSVDANMAPTLDWLQTRLDLDDAGLRKAVLVKPQLLNYSVEDNMAPTLEWLQTSRPGRSPNKGGATTTATAGLQRRGQHGAEAGLATDASRTGRGAAEEDGSDASGTAKL